MVLLYPAGKRLQVLPFRPQGAAVGTFYQALLLKCYQVFAHRFVCHSKARCQFFDVNCASLADQDSDCASSFFRKQIQSNPIIRNLIQCRFSA